MAKHRSTIRHAVVAGFVVAFLSLFPVTGAEAGVRCYPDNDGDGYGTGTGVTFDQESCPNRYAEKRGDCNDALAGVHPGRGEIAYNWVDDNCALGVDEPTFRYFAEGNRNTVSSFRMTVNLNHSDIVGAALQSVLYVEVEYARLSNSQNPLVFPLTQVISYGGDFTVNLTLSSLDSITPYRARVTFYKKLGANSYQQVGSTSDWYYTITDGAAFKTQRRALMVLKGFKELDESNNEQVGYRGAQVDGTRYGADAGEEWCSEFYSWITGSWLTGVSGLSSWRRLMDFFSEANSFYSPSEIPARAAPGDYLPLDTDQDGDVNHSGMFLAYDASQSPAAVWSLEGNLSNKVQVRSRDFTYTTWKRVNVGISQQWVIDIGTFAGLGYILTSQLQ